MVSIGVFKLSVEGLFVAALVEEVLLELLDVLGGLFVDVLVGGFLELLLTLLLAPALGTWMWERSKDIGSEPSLEESSLSFIVETDV